MQDALKHEFPIPFPTLHLVGDHVIANSSYRSTLSISAYLRQSYLSAHCQKNVALIVAQINYASLLNRDS